MSKDDDLYSKFSSDSKKRSSFKSSVFIPFLSGILGTLLVIGIIFEVPDVRNKFINTIISNSNNALETSTTDSSINNYISLSDYSDTAVYAANKVLPSIVGIDVEYTVTSNIFQGVSQLSSAEGSGIIMSSDGYILTNNHIINSSDLSMFYEVSDASKVTVYLYNDETPYEAEIIGTDEKTDLAVIKIEKDNLPAAELGDSSSIKIGEFAMAIGNPLGMQSSVTSGIISAINRTVKGEDGNKYTLIQTDAAINAGNSGGALINSEGKVIGINTLKLSGTGIEGMGFAIPINDTLDIYKELIEYGKIARPYIGVSGMDLDVATAKYYNLPVGIYLKEIQKNSPAETSGLKTGDIITAINDKEVKTMEDLNSVKDNLNIGDKITLTIYRNGESKKIDLTLGETP